MKKITLIPLLLFVFLFWKNTFAQKQGQARIDSLQAVLKTAKEDTNKVNTLNTLARILENANPDSSIILSTRALQLSEKIKWQLGIGISHQCLGIFADNKSDYALSLEHYSKALVVCEELEKSGVIPKLQVLKLKSGTLGDMGVVYDEQGNYSKALDYDLKDLKIEEEFGLKQTQPINLSNIGRIYWSQADYPNALLYCFKGLKIAEELGLKQFQSSIIGNIGALYKIQGDYPKALDYLFKSLKMHQEFNDKIGQAQVLGTLAGVYHMQGNYTKAMEYSLKGLKMAEECGDKDIIAEYLADIAFLYEGQAEHMQDSDKFGSDSLISLSLNYYLRALKIKEEIGAKNGIASILGDIGSTYIMQKKFKEADKFLHEALKLATEIKALNLIESENGYLSELYSKEGDWKNAYEHYKQAIVARDSINNEEKARKQTRIEMNYEFEKTQAVDSAKHEKEMAVANVENKRQKLFKNVSLGGFSVMLLFAGVFFTQRNRISKGKKRSDELLLNILPSETAEELKLTGEAKAKDYDMVSVLFTDFKNFTQVSEKMSAAELVKDIHHYYCEFDKIIVKHNIEKIKTIGDSYMCAGGLPVENKTNPVEVVQAALEIQQFIEKEKEERLKNNKPFFEVRIGINTGPVVAGIVGIKKFAYDIWGDTVNIASRMESSGEVGKVNISGSTYELVKDKFSCTYRGKIDAKNKGMIDMYFVERVIS